VEDTLPAVRAFLFAVFTSIVLLAFPSRAIAAPEAPSALARVKTTGVLRWGGDLQGGEPYASLDDKGQMVGFEVELAHSLARELGVKDEFVQNDWANLVPSLERGTFDIAMNGLEITEARAGRVLFSRPYYVFAERLMVRKDDARPFAATIASLTGKRVGTLSNSLAFELLRGKAEVVQYDGTEEPYIDLVNHRTDAVLLDDIIATRYGVPHEELRVVGDVTDGAYAIGLLPGDRDLKDALDLALDRIIRAGELEAILRRHGIWNERQAAVATWKAPTVVEKDAPVAARPKMPLTWSHFGLFLRGAAMTLLLSVLAMLLAVGLGIALALARLYGSPLVRFVAHAYVEIYRGTPVLLQLYVLYYGLAPIVRIGALPAAVIGLGMNYAAYEAEVYRAGMQAVPKGQLEAAYALGMTTRLALRRVLLPQAFRLALPNVTNDFIALLKDSSLVSVITVVELTKQMTITAVDVRGWLFPGLLCALLYFMMSYPLSRVARRLETRLARS
jgi:polar amino acid transport system substrate-binding protein